MESKDLSKNWVYGEPKTRIQLLFVDYNGILCMDLVIHANAQKWSEDTKDFSRDVIFVIKAFYIFLCQYGRDIGNQASFDFINCP